MKLARSDEAQSGTKNVMQQILYAINFHLVQEPVRRIRIVTVTVAKLTCVNAVSCLFRQAEKYARSRSVGYICASQMARDCNL